MKFEILEFSCFKPLMKKTKYHFNLQSLSFEKVTLTFWQRFRFYFLVGLAFALLMIFTGFFAGFFVDTPKERAMRRELNFLREQTKEFKKQIEFLGVIATDLQERDDNIYRVIFESEPIPRTLREAAIGGVERYNHLQGFSESQLLAETQKSIDQLSRRLYVQSKSFDEVFDLAKRKADMLASIPAIFPIDNGKGRLVSGFGFRIHPILKIRRMHTGVDFAAPTGTKIFSTGNGVVSKVEFNRSGYGLTIEIDHGFGYKTLYAHLSRVDVRPGQKISRGQLIGRVGNTGLSKAPHLHYEVIKKGEIINPINYFHHDLSPGQFEEIYEIASRENQSLG